jgi:aminoglycoside phosphotransferase (APT) family kinase protein
MNPIVPEQARWSRPEPRRALEQPALERMIRAAFPRGHAIDVEPLAEGRRNANFKFNLDSGHGSFVLRIYEHNPALCQKELDLVRLIGDSAPAPEVIHAEPRGVGEFPPFLVMRFVDGISFRDLRRGGDLEAIAQAAFSAGETLAAIGRHRFSKPGWLAPGPVVTAPLIEGPDPIPRFVDSCLASENLRGRMPADVRDRMPDVLWRDAARLAALSDETNLVHGDFNKRNLLVRSIAGRWRVAAVLDWEFAVSGCPLQDFGNFLRYERASRPRAEPHFSAGYRNGGGTLPDHWRYLAKLVDLTALCASLAQDSLPDDVAAELVEIVRETCG